MSAVEKKADLYKEIEFITETYTSPPNNDDQIDSVNYWMICL